MIYKHKKRDRTVTVVIEVEVEVEDFMDSIHIKRIIPHNDIGLYLSSFHFGIQFYLTFASWVHVYSNTDHDLFIKILMSEIEILHFKSYY